MRDITAQIIKFVFVGGTATLLDFVILYYMHYQMGMNHFTAATFAFTIATFYNYYMSMKYVFKSKFDESTRHKEIIAFFVLSIIGLLITLAGLAVFVDWMRMDVMIAKVLVGVLVMIFNFVTRKIYFEG